MVLEKDTLSELALVSGFLWFVKEKFNNIYVVGCIWVRPAEGVWSKKPIVKSYEGYNYFLVEVHMVWTSAAHFVLINIHLISKYA